MNSNRALVKCAVLSIKDSHFVYPCCKICLSKLTRESNVRFHCFRCGFTCDLQNVENRYRLSLKVSQNKSIFGVTIFGGCLNPFFGITADCLQRFLNSSETGQFPVKDLLVKAVEDCFIGKSFILGFKTFALDSESRLLGKQTSSLRPSKESAHFVACQITSTNGAFQGITVYAYLQSLLRTHFQLCSFASPKAVCQSQDKDSLISSFENTLPLCMRSDSESSGMGLSPWHPTTNVSLLFSPEETNGHSLQQQDNVKCIPLQYVCTQGHEHDPEVSLLYQGLIGQGKSTGHGQYVDEYESEDGMHSKLSISNESTLCSVIDQFYPCDLCVCSKDHNPKNNMSCVSKSKRPVAGSRWLSLLSLSSEENIASSFQKSNLIHSGEISSFGLKEAPLSKTLGAFVCIQPQISEMVDKCLLMPQSKLEKVQTTSRQDNCVLTDNMLSKMNVTMAYQSVFTPLRNITNVIRENARTKSKKKRMHKKRRILFANPCSSSLLKMSPPTVDCSSCFFDLKDVAKRKSLTKNTVSMAHCLQNQQRSELFQDMDEKGSGCGSQGEEYNCSADLFYHNSIDINLQGGTEKLVSDSDEMRKDCVLDASSESKVLNSFHFAPALQSTPIAYTNDHCSSGQGRKISKYQQSKKRMTLTPSRIRSQGKWSYIRQGSNAEKAELCQTKSSDITSLSGTDIRGNAELNDENTVAFLNINEWSRDLFDHSF